MDTTKRALGDIAMLIEDACDLPRPQRITMLRQLAAAAKDHNISEFTLEDVTLTDERWNQVQRSISMQLGCADAED